MADACNLVCPLQPGGKPDFSPGRGGAQAVRGPGRSTRLYRKGPRL